MAEKQPIKEQIKKLTDQIEAGIKALFQSGDLEKYQAYLHTMSHFHHYSVNNQMLIFSQCPHATLVAGYQKWQNQFMSHRHKSMMPHALREKRGNWCGSRYNGIR